MQAAFVDIGLEKNAFLYVDEVVAPEGLEGRSSARHPVAAQARPAGDGAGHQRRHGHQGRARHHRDHAAGSLPRADAVLGVRRRVQEGAATKSATGSTTVILVTCPRQMGVIVRTVAQGASERDLCDRPRVPAAALEAREPPVDRGTSSRGHLHRDGSRFAPGARRLLGGLRAPRRRRQAQRSRR